MPFILMLSIHDMLLGSFRIAEQGMSATGTCSCCRRSSSLRFHSSSFSSSTTAAATSSGSTVGYSCRRYWGLKHSSAGESCRMTAVDGPYLFQEPHCVFLDRPKRSL